MQLIVNGDNANTATTVVGYGLSIINGMSARYALEARVGDGGRTALSPWSRASGTTPSCAARSFSCRASSAYIAMLTAVVSAALSIVREKETGDDGAGADVTHRAGSYVLGKTIPYFFVSLASAILIVLLAMALFGLPMRGSWGMLLVTVSLFLVGALAWGLLISTIADSQQVAFQVALLSSFLPTLLLSGFIFPISGMPAVLQAVTLVVPARYFLAALRAIVLKGAGVAAYWPDLAALAVFALAVMALASLRLRRQWA